MQLGKGTKAFSWPFSLPCLHGCDIRGTKIYKPIYLCLPSPLPICTHLFHSSFWQLAQANCPNFFQELFSQIKCDMELIIPLGRCWRTFIAMGHLHPQCSVPFELHLRDPSTTHTPFPHPEGAVCTHLPPTKWSLALTPVLKISLPHITAFPHVPPHPCKPSFYLFLLCLLGKFPPNHFSPSSPPSLKIKDR